MFLDWPDYDSSSESEVEPILAEDGSVLTPERKSHKVRDLSSPAASPSSPGSPGSPGNDSTAQRIMHLLTELGSPHVVGPAHYEYRHVIQCTNCKGQLLIV